MAANPSSTPTRKQTVTNLPLSVEDLREVVPGSPVLPLPLAPVSRTHI
jgi:hypothetical protein